MEYTQQELTEINGLITDLESKGAVDVHQASGRVVGRKRVLQVNYRLMSGGALQKMQTAKITEHEGAYVFYEKVPTILRETPTVTPPRDFHKTAEWISTRFSQRFTGWTAHRVNQRRDGDDDIVTIEAINPDDQIVERKIKMWMDGENVQFKEIA